MASRITEAVTLNLAPCSRCGAWRGDPCRTPSGATCAPHQARWRATLQTRGLAPDDDGRVITVDSPPGKLFTASGTHTIIAHYGDGEPHATATAAAQWLVRDTTELEPCETPNCEICAGLCDVCGDELTSLGAHGVGCPTCASQEENGI